MSAALLHGVRDLRFNRVPMPEPRGDELLLRVRSVGVCGSDLHYYLESGIGSDQIREPMVLGHEFAAEVVDARAEECGFAPGTLVAVDPQLSCGVCEWCQDGNPNLCPQVRFTGAPPHHGAMSEYFAAPRHLLHPVPAGFDADDAAMLEPLGVAIHALDLARLKPMESVAVLGAGPIGLLLLQVARASGAGDLYAIDPLSYRAQAAKELGADAVSGNLDAIREWTDGRGVDVVLEATNSPIGPQHAAEVARIGGRVILVGIPEGDEINLKASTVRRKGLTFKMSRRMKHVYPRAIHMVERGLVKLKPLVTHSFPLERAAEAFALQADYRDGVLKSMIHP
jgi:L-iditol 2-dehydrogenase